MKFKNDKKSLIIKFCRNIFLICDFLLEDNYLNLVLFCLVYFIESLQIYFFFINNFFISEWNSPTIWLKFRTVLKYVWLVRIFSDNDNYNGFIYFFYICFVLILVIYLNTIFLFYNLKKSKELFSFSKYFMIIIANIFPQILYAPILHTFMYPILCNKFTDSTGASYYRNYFFKNVKCFNSVYIMHCIFGLFGGIITIIYATVIQKFYFETDRKTNNLKARFINSKYEFLFHIIKTLWIIVYGLVEYWQDITGKYWFFCCSNFLFASLNLAILYYEKPFYNIAINKILIILRTNELVGVLITFLAKVIGSQRFKGEFYVFLVTLFFSTLFNYLYSINKYKIIIIPIENLKSDDIFLKKITYTLELIESQENKESEVLLKGYILNNNSEINSNLFKNIKKKIDEEIKLGLSSEKIKNQIEEYNIFLKFIKNCFEIGVKKFPNSNSIKLNFLLFSIKYLKNSQISMMIMKQIDAEKLSLEEYFILYRYIKIIEEKLIIQNNNYKYSNIKFDVNFEIRCIKKRNILMKLTQKITKNLLSFWKELLKKNKNFRNLENYIYSLNENLLPLYKEYKEYQKMKSNDNKTLSLIEIFLRYVLNNDRGTEGFIGKISSLNEINNNNNKEDNEEENFLGGYENYLKEGSGYVIISGDNDNLGNIISYNKTLARMFSYTYDELKDKNFQILMPELYRESHKNKINDLIEEEDPEENRENMNNIRKHAVALNKNGYIFKVNLIVKILSGFNDTINFLTFIRKPPSDTFKTYPVFILTDEDFIIKNVSCSANTILGLNNNNIQSKDLNIGLDILIDEINVLKSNKSTLYEYQNTNGMEPKKIIKCSDENIKKFNKLLNKIKKSNKKENDANERKSMVKIDLNLNNNYNNTIIENNLNNTNMDKNNNQISFFGIKNNPQKNKNNIQNSNNLLLSSKNIQNVETIFTPNILNVKINEYNNISKFNKFYLTIEEVNFSIKTLGYLIQLEPIKKINFLIDTNNIITYEENVAVFNPNLFQFEDPESSEELNNKFTSKKFILNNIVNTSSSRQAKTKKNIERPSVLNHQALLSYLFKKRNIKNYAQIQKVKVFLKTSGKPEKKAIQDNNMKIDDKIKSINDIIKNPSFTEKELIYLLDDDENEINQGHGIEERELNNFLNFSGIEGWYSNFIKISKNQLPRKLYFLTIAAILSTILKIFFIIFCYIKNHNSIKQLKTIFKLGNETCLQSYYFIDSVTRIEILKEFFDDSSDIEIFSDNNETLENNINFLELLTYNIKIINPVNNYHPYNNFSNTYDIIDKNSLFKTINLSFGDIILELLNRLYNIRDLKETYPLDMKIYIINSLNSYIMSLDSVLKYNVQLFDSKKKDFKKQLELMTIFSLILILFCVLNIILEFNVSEIKRNIIKLFFYINEKIIIKYQKNCTEFLNFFQNNNDTSKKDKNNEENKEKNEYNYNFNNSDDEFDNLNNSSFNEENKSSFISSSSGHSQNSEKKKKKKKLTIAEQINEANINNKNSFILRVFAVNIIILIFDYAYYLMGYLFFKLYINKLQKIEEFICLIHIMRIDLNLFYLNQYQIHSNSNIDVFNLSNVEFHEKYYIKNSQNLDKFLEIWYNDGQKIFSDYKFEGDNDTTYTITDLINYGVCNYNNKYNSICKDISKYFKGFIFSYKYTYDFLIYFYLNFKENNVIYNFKNPDFYNLTKYLINYVSPVTNDILDLIFYMLEKILNKINKNYKILVSIYIVCNIFVITFFWLLLQTREIKEIIYSKTTLFLLSQNDVKDNKYIMDFFIKEIISNS